jgi:hypothetical protein
MSAMITLRRIYDGGAAEGEYIEIGSDDDVGDLIAILCTGKSAEYFGHAKLMFHAPVARLLAKALLAAADEAEAEDP